MRFFTLPFSQVIRPDSFPLLNTLAWVSLNIYVSGFLAYCAIITVFLVVMIYRVAPSHGKRNPLVYISICSVVGSITVMSVKAFGLALKLTLAPDGQNQFSHPSTYVFAIVLVICILTQTNYFNKALSQFSSSL